jgi:ATP synthase protein I
MADDSTGSNQQPKGGKGPLGDLVSVETILQLALAIPAGCFVGLLLGGWLDRHFHTKWIAVTLLLLGAAGGFIHVFTYLARISKRGDQ